MTIDRLTPREQWPEFLRIAEFGALLDISTGTAYEMVRSGAVEAVRCGRLIRVPRAAVERLLGAAPHNGNNGHPGLENPRG